MAERRMFAKTIIDSDAFLDMPLSAQCLYFHLSMRADDDGFVNNPKKIQRMIGASDDDCRLLALKKFIIAFESGVIVIKHWKIHNYIRKDTYNETNYKFEKSLLSIDENNAYTQENNVDVMPSLRDCNSSVDGSLTQDRIGKERIGKDSITVSEDTVYQTETVRPDIKPVVDAWNALSNDTAIKPISKMLSTSKRYQMLVARIKEYSLDDVLKAIEKIKQSDFLKGNNNKGWIITFDWFVRPNNFPKVFEGDYDNRGSSNNPYIRY